MESGRARLVKAFWIFPFSLSKFSPLQTSLTSPANGDSFPSKKFSAMSKAVVWPNFPAVRLVNLPVTGFLDQNPHSPLCLVGVSREAKVRSEAMPPVVSNRVLVPGILGFINPELLGSNSVDSGSRKLKRVLIAATPPAIFKRLYAACFLTKGLRFLLKG